METKFMNMFDNTRMYFKKTTNCHANTNHFREYQKIFDVCGFINSVPVSYSEFSLTLQFAVCGSLLSQEFQI